MNISVWDANSAAEVQFSACVRSHGAGPGHMRGSFIKYISKYLK